MELERRTGILEYGKLAITLVALGGFLLFTGAPRVKAGEAECQHRTERADHELHEAIKHHGWDSKQAEHARHELSEAREYCWAQDHKWWDVEAHEWRSERHWDDDHGHQ
jgi:hypothetical protein